MGKNFASLDYHLKELAIARDSRDVRSVLPRVPQSCRRILDVGCGIGQSLLALDLPSVTEAHGVDVDGDAVNYGRRESPQLRLAIAPGESLPYPDNHFDYLFCRVALPYMNIPRALHEFARVLIPGSTVWLSVHPMAMFRRDVSHAVRGANLKSVVYRLYALANTGGLLVGSQFRYPLNPNRMESYQPAAFIRRALRRARFTNIRATTERGVALVSAELEGRRG